MEITKAKPQFGDLDALRARLAHAPVAAATKGAGKGRANVYYVR